jgi:GNAT superfamily N-acetyltransferase
VTVTIRPVSGEVDRAALVAIVNQTTPDDSTSLDDLAWADETYPGSVRFLAVGDDGPVAAATVGRIYMYPPDFGAFWGSIGVLPAARRNGIGTRLYGAISAVARDAGKTHLHVAGSEARPEGLAFLRHRGFTEWERHKVVRLDLAGMARPDVPPPEGIRLTTLAERPELLVGVHAVAVATFADIPSGEASMTAGDLEEFRARDVDKLPDWGFVVATATGTDDVVGYASLYPVPGRDGIYYHDMTTVVRPWRGRGLATALKAAVIRAALAHGVVALETDNATDNAAMRAVNARFGYRPLPDVVTMRGPLAGGIMGG